ncbi:hypothetical protein HAX54_022311 [Datura stramonium]|uniref:Uncharacterized protein n=1 Tax=Datura stramonium TaxID=4076 RepID=A0ABS8UUC1_DATST|nr:hypothetical protein [Datura stramonium]
MDALPCARHKAISATVGVARQHHAHYAMREAQQRWHNARREALSYPTRGMQGLIRLWMQRHARGTRPSIAIIERGAAASCALFHARERSNAGTMPGARPSFPAHGQAQHDTSPSALAGMQ